MSSQGLSFTNVPQIDTGVSAASTDRAVAPRTNALLQLAGSLQDLNPKLVGAFGALAKEDQEVQGKAAKALALQTGGKDLAAAVRDGDLLPTQNPYFIQDYNREAGATSSQAAFDKLNTDAATWAEKNDPGAFRQRYTEEVKKIGEAYTHPDAQEGFAATANQNLQQQMAANVAYNSQRIVQERQENLSALTAKAIISENARQAGKATGQDIDLAVEPLKQQWLATGGSLAQWNRVALQGILAASFNTHSENILDAAKTMSNSLGGTEGGGTLYDTLGSAEQIETARYRLQSDKRDDLRLQIQERQERVYEQGLAAQGDLFQMYGPTLFSGGITADEQKTAAQMLSEKYPAAAVAEAFRSASQITSSMRELNANKIAGYESSAIGAQHIGALYQEANQRGWSEDLQKELGQLALQGDISTATQQQIMDQADRTTKTLAGQSGMTSFPGAIQKKAAQNIKQWSTIRSNIMSSLSAAAQNASRHGHSLTPVQSQQLEDQAISTASSYLETNPNDFAGAYKAAIDAVTAR